MDDYHQLLADTVTERFKRAGRFIDYIEVGVLTGNSARAVLSTMKCRWAVLIDNFSNTHCGDVKSSRKIVEQNLSGFGELFQIREGNSIDVLPTIKRWFDVGFVDGDHSAEVCKRDIELMFPLIRENGVLFVDDMRNPGYMHIEAIVREFARNKELKFTYHQVHNGVGELRKRDE